LYKSADPIDSEAIYLVEKNIEEITKSSNWLSKVLAIILSIIYIVIGVVIAMIFADGSSF